MLMFLKRVTHQHLSLKLKSIKAGRRSHPYSSLITFLGHAQGGIGSHLGPSRCLIDGIESGFNSFYSNKVSAIQSHFSEEDCNSRALMFNLYPQLCNIIISALLGQIKGPSSPVACLHQWQLENALKGEYMNRIWGE